MPCSLSFVHARCPFPDPRGEEDRRAGLWEHQAPAFWPHSSCCKINQWQVMANLLWWIPGKLWLVTRIVPVSECNLKLTVSLREWRGIFQIGIMHTCVYLNLYVLHPVVVVTQSCCKLSFIHQTYNTHSYIVTHTHTENFGVRVTLQLTVSMSWCRAQSGTVV
jgi:hypothetical protein